MTSLSLIASKILMTDSSFNTGQGISGTYTLYDDTGSRVFYFINGFLVDPVFSGSQTSGS
jgi:hypothetical protein